MQDRAAAHELCDVHAASAAQRREQLAEAQEENIRHLVCIVELEENLQVKASPVPTSDAGNLEVEGVSCYDTLDVLAQVTTDLEAAVAPVEISADKELGRLVDRCKRNDMIGPASRESSASDRAGKRSRI